MNERCTGEPREDRHGNVYYVHTQPCPLHPKAKIRPAALPSHA